MATTLMRTRKKDIRFPRLSRMKGLAQLADSIPNCAPYIEALQKRECGKGCSPRIPAIIITQPPALYLPQSSHAVLHARHPAMEQVHIRPEGHRDQPSAQRGRNQHIPSALG